MEKKYFGFTKNELAFIGWGATTCALGLIVGNALGERNGVIKTIVTLVKLAK